jgi:hypothetical protein
VLQTKHEFVSRAPSARILLRRYFWSLILARNKGESFAYTGEDFEIQIYFPGRTKDMDNTSSRITVA